MSIKAAAPGKLMLMGEHSVVYGFPCIVATIDKYLTVEIEKLDDKDDRIVTPEARDTRFIENVLYIFRKKYQKKDKVKISTKSEIGNYGLGSSAAVTVATMKALTKLFNFNLNNKELFNICFEVVLGVQKIASGFDIAAAIYGGILYYNNTGQIIEELLIDTLPLTVGYCGEKADTVSMVKLVAEKRKKNRERVGRIFQNIAQLVNQVKETILEKDWLRMGKLMNYNQDYLEDLGVSTSRLNEMILAARKAGAYGAKLSGAGGGDCMIALIPENKRNKIEEAILKAGGEIITTNPNSAGVKLIVDN